MKLLRLTAGQGISIVTVNQQNIGTVLNSLASEERDGVRSIPGLDPTTSTAIISNIQNLVNQGLEIQIPISGTTYQSFTGTGYIAINLSTGEGGYYLSGNLHGGMTVLPLIEWPPDIGLPLINEYINVVKPDNDPNAVTQLRLITPNWAVSTVGKFLDNPIQVQALDSKGVPVIGATITFQIKNGGGCLAPNETSSSLPPNLQPQPSCTDLDITVNGTTNYVGEASVEFKLGKYTNADPIYYKMTDLPSEEVTLAGLNNLNIVSQNNIGLASGYTAIGMPDKPATLTGINNAPYDMGRLAAYSGYVAGNVVDQYNNPVSNVPVVFSAATNYLGTNSSDPLFQSNYEPMAIVSWKNAGVVQGCPATPSQDNVQACEGGPVITIPTTFKGADGYVITGNVCDAIYSLTLSSPMLPNQSVVYSWDWSSQQVLQTCNTNNNYVSDVYTQAFNYTDANGHVLNAGPVKGSGSFQVDVKEQHSICSVTGEVNNSCTIQCEQNMWSASEPIQATVNAITVMGFGIAGAGIPQAVGEYTIPLVLSGTPDYEEYEVTTNINTIPVHINNPLKIDCNFIVSITPEYDYFLPLVSYYAVEITPVLVNPNPLILNSGSYSTAALNIAYTIQPQGYNAGLAQVDLLSSPPNAPDSWLPAQSLVGGTSGTATATLLQGAVFDASQNWAAQVVLNRGSQQEIDSAVVPFNVLQFYIRISNVTTKLANSTFISTDQVKADATTGNTQIDNNIFWTVVSNPQNIWKDGTVLNSGTVNFNTSQTGPTTTFTPNPPAAPDARLGRLSYVVSATITNSNIVDTFVLTQDELDELRQEYVDMKKQHIPARTEFVNSSTYSDPGGHFPFSKVNWGDYSWAIFTIADKLESMYSNYGPFTLSSGYRNPVHNANLTPPGAPESSHIYGYAADINTINPQMWKALEMKAQKLSACCEPWEESTYGHLHVDWRPTACPTPDQQGYDWDCTD